jgi:hypothetical protein
MENPPTNGRLVSAFDPDEVTVPTPLSGDPMSAIAGPTLFAHAIHSSIPACAASVSEPAICSVAGTDER